MADFDGTETGPLVATDFGFDETEFGVTFVATELEVEDLFVAAVVLISVDSLARIENRFA